MHIDVRIFCVASAISKLCDLFRFYVVYINTEEEDVQVSIWAVCLDTHDFDCGLYTVFFYRGKHI